MAVKLHLQGAYIRFKEHEVVLGDSRFALLADIEKAVVIQPNGFARVPTPIAFKGDGKTIALIRMHAGRQAYALEDHDDGLCHNGEYFLPKIGEEMFVCVDVINETGATLLIRPSMHIGDLMLVDIGPEESAAAAPVLTHETTSMPLAVEATFNPAYLDARDVPAYANDVAAGVDLRADLEKAITIGRGESVTVPTGLELAIPAGFEAQIRDSGDLPAAASVQARSINFRSGQSPIQVRICNLGEKRITINPGDNVAECVFTPVTRAALAFDRGSQTAVTASNAR